MRLSNYIAFVAGVGAIGLLAGPARASTTEAQCTPGIFTTQCTSSTYTAVAGDILIGQTFCGSGTVPGTIFVQHELVLNSGTFTDIGSAAYDGALIEANCTRGKVVPVVAVAGRRYRVRVTRTSNLEAGVRGSLLRARTITSATTAPGTCLTHNDSGEPNWFVYRPTVTDTTDSISTTSASGAGGLNSQTRRLSDGAIMCTNATVFTNSTCSFQANQGISYLIESEESRTGGGGQICLQSAAPLLHVSMTGLERRGRLLTWETSSEAGTLGFVVEHDAGSGFVAISGLLPSLSEPGGGIYGFHLPAGLRGVLRVVEYDVSGTQESHALGGEPVSELLAVSSAEAFSSRAHVAPAVARAKSEEQVTGDAARVLVAHEGLTRVSVQALAAALGVPRGTVESAIARGSLGLSDTTGGSVPYEAVADGIVFFAAVPDHVFSDVSHYLVRLGGTGEAFAAQPAFPASTDVVDTFVRAIHLEQERFAGMVVVTEPRSDLWFWQTVSPSAPLQTSFGLPGDAIDTARVTVEVHVIPGYEGGEVALWVDGQRVGSAMPDSLRDAIVFDVDAALLGAGDHTLEVRTDQGFFYVDQVDLAVPSELGDEAGAFDASADGVVTLTEGARVLDVTAPGAPSVLGGLALDAGAVSFQVTAGQRYWIDRGEAHAPEAVLGASPTDVTGDLSAEYVVIAHRSLLSALAPLVEAREADGLSTVVVDVQDVFDAYAAGTPDPEAIRTFLTNARGGWSVAPRYVLLAGHGTYDFRDLRGFGDNLVPGTVTRTTGGLFASDGYLVSDSLTSGPALPIGRLPARSPAELTSMIERILAYEGREHSSLLTVSDRPHQGDDFVTAAALASAEAPSDLTLLSVAQTGTVEEARAALIEALGDSPDAVLYFGHGGLDRVGRDGILRTQDLAQLDPEGLPALHFTLSCTVGRFDVPGFESLAEGLLRLPQGAVAVFGPAGQTTLADADALAVPIVGTLYADNARLGDATLTAVQSLGGEYDAARLFNLLGDPAMRTGAVVEPEPPTPTDPGGGVVFPSFFCATSVTSTSQSLALSSLWLVGLAVAVRRRRRPRD